ncbi:MAG: hypothetical protein ACTSUD_07425 [Alphaproteobacteria bacterium]
MPDSGTTGNSYPAAQRHDPIEELFEDVFWVQGSMRMGPGMRINRNMVVLREGGELTLISPVRMSPEGEAALDALGTVKHVMRIGPGHSLDDRYYAERYGAEFWRNGKVGKGSEPKPTKTLDSGARLPVKDAELFAFEETRLPEFAIVIKREGGILITCDALQNWENRRNCSLLAHIALPILGIKLGTAVGPIWKKAMTREGGSLLPDFERLLELDFDHLIAAHGALCRGGAKARVRAAVDRAFRA